MIKADVLKRARSAGRIIDIQENSSNVSILMADGTMLQIMRGRDAGYSVMAFETPEAPGPQGQTVDENCETGYDRDAFIEAMLGLVVLGLPHPYPEDRPEKQGYYLVWFNDNPRGYWSFHWYKNDCFGFGVCDKQVSYWLPLPDPPEPQDTTFDARSIEDLDIAALKALIREVIEEMTPEGRFRKSQRT